MMINEADKKVFVEEVLAFYYENGRHDLPWRQPLYGQYFDPYRIVVSEIMLQQTQVRRVIDKYSMFLEHFNDTKSLSNASLGEVLQCWSGLGYNRRAQYLYNTAQVIEREYKGRFPEGIDILKKLPGIGTNTAGAILAYAFNKPCVFIETNIRTVYLHSFFSGQNNVADNAIIQLVRETLDLEQPRIWYWALMDYGSYIKKALGNANIRSKSYTIQSKFEGSVRQVRGKVVKQLGAGPQSFGQLLAIIPDDRLQASLDKLMCEGIIRKDNDMYLL
jgi:A/G-specific adenine glycosylase